MGELPSAGGLMPSPCDSPGGQSSCSPRDPGDFDRAAGDSEVMRQQPRMDEELKQMFMAKGLTEENLQVIQAADDTICSVADLASGAVSETDARSWADELGLSSRVLKSRFIQSWLEARNVLHRMLEAYSPLPTGQSSPQPWSPRQAWTPEAGMSSPGGRSLGSSFRHATPPVAESPKELEDFDMLSSRCTIPDERAFGSSRESLTPTGSDIWRQPDRRPIYDMSRPSTPVRSKIDSPPRLRPLKEADGEMTLLEMEESPAETAGLSTPEVSNLDTFARLRAETGDSAGQADSLDDGESRRKDSDPAYGGQSSVGSDTARPSSEPRGFGVTRTRGDGDSSPEEQGHDGRGSARSVLAAAAAAASAEEPSHSHLDHVVALLPMVLEALEESSSSSVGSLGISTLTQTLSMPPTPATTSRSVAGRDVPAEGSVMPLLGLCDGGHDTLECVEVRKAMPNELQVSWPMVFGDEDAEPECNLLTDPQEEHMTPGGISYALRRILKSAGRLTVTEMKILEQNIPYRTVREMAEGVPNETEALRLAIASGITSKVSRLRFVDAWTQCVASITAMTEAGECHALERSTGSKKPEGPANYQLFAMTVRGDWEAATLRLMERAQLKHRQEVVPFIRGMLSHISNYQLRQEDTTNSVKVRTQRKVLPVVTKAYGSEVAKRVARRAEVFEADCRWRLVLKQLFTSRTAVALQRQILEVHRSSYFEAACNEVVKSWARRERQRGEKMTMELKMHDIEVLCFDKVIKRILPHFGFTPDARGFDDMKDILMSAACDNPVVAKYRNEISRTVLHKFFSDLRLGQDGFCPC